MCVKVPINNHKRFTRMGFKFSVKELCAWVVCQNFKLLKSSGSMDMTYDHCFSLLCKCCANRRKSIHTCTFHIQQQKHRYSITSTLHLLQAFDSLYKFEARARAKTDNGPDVSMEISACFCWYHVS